MSSIMHRQQTEYFTEFNGINKSGNKNMVERVNWVIGTS